MVYWLNQTAISFQTARLQTLKMEVEKAGELLTCSETWWYGWMSAQEPQSGAGHRETASEPSQDVMCKKEDILRMNTKKTSEAHRPR